MGYYTTYRLESDDNIDHEDDIIELYEDAAFNYSVKWYEHQDDILKYSLLHPTVIFKLLGEGEETGDLWIEYFKNGKYQYSKGVITYDEFDENKLI